MARLKDLTEKQIGISKRVPKKKSEKKPVGNSTEPLIFRPEGQKTVEKEVKEPTKAQPTTDKPVKSQKRVQSKKAPKKKEESSTSGIGDGLAKGLMANMPSMISLLVGGMVGGKEGAVEGLGVGQGIQKTQNDLKQQEHNNIFRERQLAQQKFLAEQQQQHQINMQANEIQSREDMFEQKHQMDIAKQIAASNPSTASKFAQLKGEQPKQMGLISDADNAIQGMDKILRRGGNTFELVGEDEFTVMREETKNGLLRLVSGAAIGEEENEQFMKLLPNYTDSKKTRTFKMDELKKRINRLYKIRGFEADEVRNHLGMDTASGSELRRKQILEAMKSRGIE